ncbi:hypothetical protein OCH239_07840 [Roseivivax halodurans JCM 10272]|uniref:Uncharacterized protein n=1 Tax=Roseivivax halodurans JCM 10272 TaxID=1449350 RepID=X7EJK6_9RHOB|nr:hypothetical protein [Roseivivax halodurans]ETX16065.1 hypothetical protein OCH239_07840 [Roseivivax halodurans JCM 10272]
MDAIQISHYAGALYRAHGDKAEVEAARRARECEERGRLSEAQDWRSIRAAIHSRRPPRQS